ncbi:SDR family NAD(P)-dependent oxidoreductase [Mycobacterium sp.]|uniref:SDR family NAD(P)-dependent oxidoreductase n=1 Tax=Mycobacterium sp. TaxID=1785 RepID=UPI0039C9C001
MTSTSAPAIVVVGVGPGLGLSVAHRFGKEGFAVALVSRDADRHAAYLRALDAAGVDAAAFTADAADPHATTRRGRRRSQAFRPNRRRLLRASQRR